MSIKAVLYDFDGTLADTVPLILESFKAAYIKVFGYCNRTEEDFKRYIGLPLISTFEMHDEITADKLFYAYLEYNEKLLRDNKVKLFDGVYEELTRIKDSGIVQGIVTSKRSESLQISLDLLDLNKYFDICVTKESTSKHKPDKEPLIYAARKLNIEDISEILYVGDAKGDILCARNAGAKSCLVSWTDMDKEEILKAEPDHIIKEMCELSCIIQSGEL